MTQLFAFGGQSIGASASTSFLPMNIQGWFLLGLTSFILQSKGILRVFSNSTVQRHQFFVAQCFVFFLIIQTSNPYVSTGKAVALTRWTFVSKVMSLLINILYRIVTAFLPRGKHLLNSWLQSHSTVILEPRKIKSVTVSIVSPSTCREVRRLDAMIFVFWVLSSKPDFSLSSFTFIKFGSSLVPFCFLPLGWFHLPIWADW